MEIARRGRERGVPQAMCELDRGACLRDAEALPGERELVDARGRVHGRQRLYVADASMFPDNIGVNPQHTIMALAQVFAQSLLEDTVRPSVSQRVA